jgi:hypothetical protein
MASPRSIAYSKDRRDSILLHVAKSDPGIKVSGVVERSASDFFPHDTPGILTTVSNFGYHATSSSYKKGKSQSLKQQTATGN